MRALLAPLASLAFLAFAGAAAADPVTIAPVAFSEDFETQLIEDFGEREGPVLKSYIERALTSALRNAGADVGAPGGVTVEVTLLEAAVTKPTMEQLSRQLSLDYSGSVSVGGAELVGVLRAPDGRILAEVNHRRFAWSLADTSLGGSWGDARRSIRLFAAKVARAYRSQLSSAELVPA